MDRNGNIRAISSKISLKFPLASVEKEIKKINKVGVK
jgi:hypothetical protein